MSALLDLGRDDDAHIHQRLTDEPVIWLASVTAEHRPHTVPVWFSWDDPTIMIFSTPTTFKLRNIRKNPAVTLALDTAAGGGDVVTLNGTAELLDPSTASAATTPAFAAKYTELLGPGAIEGWSTQFTQPIRVTIDRILAWTSSPTGPQVRVVTAPPT